MINHKKNVRYYSFRILSNVFFNNKLLNDEINETFLNNSLSCEDQSFIKKECTGVIEKLDTIDEIINNYSKIKTNKLKKDILIVFRFSIYEILYLERVPCFATINEAINIIKNTKYKALSGYVNATLRNISNNEHPLLENNNKYCYFRIFNNKQDNVLKELKDKNIEYYKYDGKLDFKHSLVYYTNSYKDIINLDSFKDGSILIIDASSIFLTDIIYDILLSKYNITKEDYEFKALDTCASPGGKTFCIYDLIGKNIKNVYFEARDISNKKISILKENASRLNFKNINFCAKDASKLDINDKEKFDLVICDVPCSGLGVVNKKPDIAINYSEEKRDSLVDVQRKILDVSKEYVKNDGILSYSTCTETNEENEDNIKFFLSNNNDFEVLYEKQIIHGDENKSDGFYICIMKRNAEYKRFDN